MKILKITILGLLITLYSCSKMDTNSGSGKVKTFKELNNWIVDKTTSKSNLDQKIELQLDTIISLAKKNSLYPDELEMEVITTTEVDLEKQVNKVWIWKPNIHSLAHLNENEKIAVLSKFKSDNTSFRVLTLRFRDRITDIQFQYEYLLIMFDQNGNYALLKPQSNDTDFSTEGIEYLIGVKIKEIIEKRLVEIENEQYNATY